MRAFLPVLLKHPYASSSRGLASCADAQTLRACVEAWLREWKVPCIVQQKITFTREVTARQPGTDSCIVALSAYMMMRTSQPSGVQITLSDVG